MRTDPSVIKVLSQQAKQAIALGAPLGDLADQTPVQSAEQRALLDVMTGINRAIPIIPPRDAEDSASICSVISAELELLLCSTDSDALPAAWRRFLDDARVALLRVALVLVSDDASALPVDPGYLEVMGLRLAGDTQPEASSAASPTEPVA